MHEGCLFKIESTIKHILPKIINNRDFNIDKNNPDYHFGQNLQLVVL